MTLSRFYILLGVAALVSGCAQQPQPAVEPEPPQASPVSDLKPEPPSRPFDADTLYSLLVAELAGSRGKLDIALANYTQQARKTRDPQVAERAYTIARYTRNQNAALEASLLWAAGDRDDQDAQAAAILGLIEADRLIEALEATRHAHTRDNGALLQSIAASAREVTPIQRQALLATYREMLTEHPENISLQIGTALLLQQQGQIPEAHRLAEQAVQQDATHTPALILLSGLLHQQQENQKAIALVEHHLAARPDDTRLRLQLARLLTFSDLARAQKEFQQLADSQPHNGDILLALALVATELGDQQSAEYNYRALLALGSHTNAAHQALGQQALLQQDTDKALEHLLQVTPGTEFFNTTTQVLGIYLQQGDYAQARAHVDKLAKQFPEQREPLFLLHSQSLIEAGEYQSAKDTLDEGLQEFRNSNSLLYARALLQERQGKVAEAETDLRQLLTYDPNNPTALNALGYILADNTERYQEAHEYIARALEQQPDDPATLDSMGWVLYKLGQPEKAIEYLRRAMDLYPDDEIAAHLGEALWQSNQRDAAREAWRQGLEINPHSTFISETLERLNVDDF